MSNEFKKGFTDPVGDCGKFEASIDVGAWGARIAVFGDTPADAEQLRDVVFAAITAPQPPALDMTCATSELQTKVCEHGSFKYGACEKCIDKRPPALGGEPELDCLADIPYANETPADWDPDYRKIWQELQVATRNKSQLRAHLAPLQAEIERLQQKLGREENEHCTTVNARDNAEKVADEMAKAIGEKFRVDVGEHSNMNCPWGMALSILNGEYVTDSDVERERDQLKADLAERWEQIAELNSEAVQLKALCARLQKTIDLSPCGGALCEGDPDSCENNEGHGCDCTALSKPAGSEQV